MHGSEPSAAGLTVVDIFPVRPQVGLANTDETYTYQV